MNKAKTFGLAAIAALVVLASSYMIGGRYTLHFDNESGVWTRLDRLTGNVALCVMVEGEAFLTCIPSVENRRAVAAPKAAPAK